MPSIKAIESNKNSTPESFNNTVESGGNDGFSSAKDVQQSQTIVSAVVSNNGSAKEQPANPLQQIILIIEHKIRNLEKRKNKLESYKTIEKSGKKLTGDQKIAVSKYDECLTSLELTRELSKQFQSIAAVANKEAKKEAKRGAFVRAQQENAKIREVLTIQDVLRRLAEEGVREDFRNGENGACKITEEDLTLLERLFEETQPKRPENTVEPTFVSTVKQAADHLSAVVDGRNKAFGDSTYVHIKAVISQVQDCGYFEKDIVTVQEDANQVDVKEDLTDADVTDDSEEAKVDENCANVENIEEQKVSGSSDPDTLFTSLQSSNDAGHSPIFAEAPAAAAVPTPSFPTQPNSIRQNPIPPAAIVTGGMASSSLITPPIQLPTPVIGTTSGIIPPNTTNVQPATIIVPTGPVTVPVIQSSAAPLQPIHGQQIGATTVQAVEHAYFKQHYIQQQMRPIHEVIGTGNFFFLQESEIDKPDVIPSPVQFVNAVTNNANITSTAVASQQPLQQQQTQVHVSQTNNPSNLPSTNQQVLGAQPSTITSSQQQTATISAQSSTYNNQQFQAIGGSANTFNHSLQTQTVEPRQQGQPTSNAQHSQLKPSSVAKSNELGHIPGFASCNTTVVSTPSILPNAQSSLQMQSHQHQPSQSHAQVQRQVNQNLTVPQQKTAVVSQGALINTSYSPSVQQFPSLIQGLQDSSSQVATNNMTQKLSTRMVDSTTEKLKPSINIPEKLSVNTPSHLSQSSHQPKQRHDEWNRGTDFVSTLAKPDDQWSNNSVQINNSVEECSQEKTQYNLSRQPQQKQHVVTPSANIASIAPNASNRVQQNGNSSSNFGTNCNVQDMSTVHGHTQQPQAANSIQHLHQTGHRNARSASNSQYHQNNGSNARFQNDNGINNSAPTFFKNNERFYQQNQNNNFVSNKTDSNYHQRSSLFKSRADSNGNPPSRNSGYGSNTGSNTTVGTSNNGGVSGGMDYRSNARPVNSTRNTGPPSSRPQQRNHSGNGNYTVPRGGSNTRGQPTINA